MPPVATTHLPPTAPAAPSAPDQEPPAGRTARWPVLSVSERVLVALMSIAALGLLLVTVVHWWTNDRVRDQEIDRNLTQGVDELRRLAQGNDPATGEPFTSVSSLLSIVLSRNVPGPHEGFLVTIDGRVPFLPPFEDRLPLEDHSPVVETALRVQPGDPAAPHEVEVEGHTIRFVTVPVSVAGDPAHGVFVVGTDVTASHEELDRARVAQVLLLVGTAIAIGILAALTVNALLRPLRTLAGTAARITEEDLSERIPEAGADDIAELMRTVNGMLDRLERAFEGQRALLDDVGHELRTPLTVIRGQLEVMDATDPADVGETRALVLDETDRMARLVEDLVLLARSMRPDFVTLQENAMDSVVEALMERVGPLGPRRWRVDHLSGARIEGDAQRLVQAGLQLAANAVRHTREGDEIGVGAAVDGDVVRLWVRDSGEGVPAAEQQRIFERAVRGTQEARRDVRSAARTSSDTTSSGLGLSIVAAIAQAHGGRVTLASTAGAGSTFAIEMPLAGAGSGAGAAGEEAR